MLLICRTVVVGCQSSVVCAVDIGEMKCTNSRVDVNVRATNKFVRLFCGCCCDADCCFVSLLNDTSCTCCQLIFPRSLCLNFILTDTYLIHHLCPGLFGLQESARFWDIIIYWQRYVWTARNQP